MISTPAHADHLWKGGWADKTVITVESEPGIDVAAAVKPWNDMAGRTLLKPVPPGTRAQVLWSPSTDATWVEWKHDASGFLTDCRVRYNKNAVHVMQHEIGHCLGFHDHTRVPDPYGRTTLRQCNEPDQPNYSAYRGVMAYCGFGSPSYRAWRWFGAADIEMMRRAGY